MAAHSRGPGAQGGAAAPHRRHRRAPAVAPERRVRRLRAGPPRRSVQPGRARAPGAPGRRDRRMGQLAALCERAGEARGPAPRGRYAAASRARLRRGDRTARRGDRDLPARRQGRSRQQRRSSRWIACTAAPSSGTSWPRSSASEIRVAQADETVALSSGSRRSTSWRWSTCRRPSRPTARSWSPIRPITRHAPRWSGCSWAARSRPRSPTSSSRSTARARSGRSWTRSTRCSSVG